METARATPITRAKGVYELVMDVVPHAQKTIKSVEKVADVVNPLDQRVNIAQLEADVVAESLPFRQAWHP